MAETAFRPLSTTAFQCIACRAIVEVLPGAGPPDRCESCEEIMRRPTTERMVRPPDDPPPKA